MGLVDQPVLDDMIVCNCHTRRPCNSIETHLLSVKLPVMLVFETKGIALSRNDSRELLGARMWYGNMIMQ